jgi:general secretion pathway protein E/type IV pilus assembly protein PilB
VFGLFPEPAAHPRTSAQPGDGAFGARTVGCRECRFAGDRGRVGVFELLEMDGRLREATFRRQSTMKLREQARQTGGLKSLLEDGIRKVLEGVTTIDEILTVARREDIVQVPTG